MQKLINEVIADIRKKHKLSRKGLENLSGFKERTIIAYERGEREVSKEYIEFMSLYFGYTEDYVRGKGIFLLSDFLQIVNIYQSIYDYDDEKMSKLLNISINEYQESFNFTSKAKYDHIYCNNRTNEVFIILEKLNIKPSSMKLFLYNIQKNEIHRDSKILNLDDRYNKLELNGINITPEYYANIIKKRNEPKENYTPISEVNKLPEKYKEIIELLPFAPDSFIDTLIEKLKTLKEAQKL